MDPLTQLHWLGGWENVQSNVLTGATYGFWAARLRDMREQYHHGLKSTAFGQHFPPEFTCVIYTLMSHLYDEKGMFVGWQEDAWKELEDLFVEMKYFVAPIIVAGTLKPQQWDWIPGMRKPPTSCKPRRVLPRLR